MKKLIEFQEEKHKEVLDVIAQYRADNNTTFSEAIRQLILMSQNGIDCPTLESVTYVSQDPMVEDLERKFDQLHDIVITHIKKHTEK
jgi:hypothetical protein